MVTKKVQEHFDRVTNALSRRDVQALSEAFSAAAKNGLHEDSGFWKLVEQTFQRSKEWDRLLAGMYKVPEFRRHPHFLDLALAPRWPAKSSRVAEYLPYPHIHEISERLKDLGYVPEDVITRVSLLSKDFPEFRALDLYLRRNGRYAFRMLLTDRDSLKTFLRFVHAWENVHGRVPGKQVIERVHKLFPDLHSYRMVSPRSFEDLLRSAGDINAIHFALRDDLKGAARRYGVDRFIVEPGDFAHIPRFIEYARRYAKDIRPLPGRPEDLFRYKFGHISDEFVDGALRLREYLASHRMIVPIFDLQSMLQHLDDAAIDEQLHDKNGCVASLLRSAYEKVREGKIHELSSDELRAIRSKKVADREGLSETRRLLEKIVDRHAVSSGVLSLAGTVPEHFGALSAGGSCYAPGHDQFTLGAVGTTGGPALVFYVKDSVSGVAVAHQVYNLYRRGDNYFFVPNDLYGTENAHISKITSNLMEEHGLPVFSGDALPKGAHPAESRHTIRDFYSDVQSKRLEFAPYKRR